MSRTETKGFTDAATIHSALAALAAGSRGASSNWDKRGLVEATYMLLHKSIRIAPGVGRFAGASGLYSTVVSAFPGLNTTVSNRQVAATKRKAWLSMHRPRLKAAWRAACADADFTDWAASQRRLFWPDHVAMYGALFNEEFVSAIASVLNVSEADLQAVHNLTRDLKQVTVWSKQNQLVSESVTLAESSWLISSMIRGKDHEFLAREEDVQLFSHPFRRGIEAQLPSATLESLLNSEVCFTRILIGSALLETTPERRVGTWTDNLAAARRALELGSIALPEASVERDAERHAINAAKVIGLPTVSARVRRVFDVVTAAGLGTLLGLGVAPWAAPVGPVAIQTYRHLRNASVGDDIAKALFATQWRFRRLARMAPGRVERRHTTTCLSGRGHR